MKQIRSATDLAINGAPPAFAEPLHVGLPNLGDRAAFMARVGGIYDQRRVTNNGPLLRDLEERVARHLGVRNCVAMSNGTVALEIAIRALGLQGEVIVPSYTFIATAHALHWQAITPVFADIDPQTHNLDPAAVERMISSRTTGIIGVHLWGRPAPVDELQRLADRHGLQLMFDAAHAFGCSHHGRRIGGFGRCEVLSFHATKVFNTFEGGAVTTDDDELADTMRLMRNFGFAGFDNVIHPGTNGKMTEVCAAMGLVNLDALDGFVDGNRRRYAAYREAFAGMQGVRVIDYDPESTPNFHYVVLEVDANLRDDLVAALHAENILARRYFWPGCHRMRPYRDLFPNAGLMLPMTGEVAAKVVVLPSGAQLADDTPQLVADIARIVISGVGS